MGSRSHPVFVAERQISLGDSIITYTVKRSSVARHIRLLIGHKTGFTIVVPRNCSLAVLDGILKSKSRWILKKINQQVQAKDFPETREVRFGDTVPYLGQELRVVGCGEARPAESVRLQDHTLLINSQSSELSSILRQWYRTQATMLLKQKADRFAAGLGLAHRRMTIRDQKTRWGSCSQIGTLSFNWRLVMAPEPVIDYVVLHEVAHLKEMNHSKKFWELVSQHCPSWREHKRWLSDHEKVLTGYL